VGLEEWAVSENLDLVRLIFAHWGRGDFSWIGWADPEIKVVIVDGPEPGVRSGLGEMTDAWREYVGAWYDYRFVVDDVRELDEERVLVLYRRTGRGKRSGLEIGEVQSEGANVFHLDGGKVTKMVRYWDRERALADLGLEE
jgi:ketosteroid isomerase-like protein